MMQRNSELTNTTQIKYKNSVVWKILQCDFTTKFLWKVVMEQCCVIIVVMHYKEIGKYFVIPKCSVEIKEMSFILFEKFREINYFSNKLIWRNFFQVTLLCSGHTVRFSWIFLNFFRQINFWWTKSTYVTSFYSLKNLSFDKNCYFQFTPSMLH